jgi:hypothetical protein
MRSLVSRTDLAEEVGWNDGGELFLLQPVHVQAPHHVLHAGCRTRLHTILKGQCQEMNNFLGGLKNQISTVLSVCAPMVFIFLHLNCLDNYFLRSGSLL